MLVSISQDFRAGYSDTNRLADADALRIAGCKSVLAADKERDAMRARLLLTYPAGRLPDGTVAPFAPALLVEDEVVGMFTSDWITRFDNTTLDMLTERKVRDRLRLDSGVTVVLAPVRQVPGTDLYSKTVSVWRQQCWSEVVAALKQQFTIAKAS